VPFCKGLRVWFVEAEAMHEIPFRLTPKSYLNIISLTGLLEKIGNSDLDKSSAINN